MKWRRAAGWALLLWLASPGGGHASDARAQSRDERAVRAAYVYNLLKYVDWPANRTELVIAFEGDPATGEILGNLLNGRLSETRRVRVVQFPSAEELEQSSVLYLTDGSGRDLRPSLDRVKGRNVLTVGESEAFALAGGMVALVNDGEHIRIEVNLNATQQAGIRISSRVLSLATIVHSAPDGGR